MFRPVAAVKCSAWMLHERDFGIEGFGDVYTVILLSPGSCDIVRSLAIQPRAEDADVYGLPGDDSWT